MRLVAADLSISRMRRIDPDYQDNNYRVYIKIIKNEGLDSQALASRQHISPSDHFKYSPGAHDPCSEENWKVFPVALRMQIAICFAPACFCAAR